MLFELFFNYCYSIRCTRNWKLHWQYELAPSIYKAGGGREK